MPQTCMTCCCRKMKWCYIGLLGGIILTVLIILEYSFRKPIILFDIPENWEVTRMEIGEGCRERSYSDYYSGIVELTNKNGIKITFTQWTIKPLSCGNGSAFDYIVDYEIEKMCDAKIINCKDDFKENCVIAKIFQKGCTSPEGEYSEYNTFCYAIVPESKTGVGCCNIVEFQEVCSFNYFAPYSAVTCLFDRSLTEEEEKEIIQILSKFSISDERGLNI